MLALSVNKQEGEILVAFLALSLSLSLIHYTRPTGRVAAALLADVARGLAHAHARGVIHRDISPKNILVHEAGDGRKRRTAVVADFGLARLESAGTLSSDGRWAGTPRYKSPEQHRGETKLTTASDVFSLGLLAYYMAAEDHPFADRDHTGLSVAVGITGVVPDFPTGAADWDLGTAWKETIHVAQRCLAYIPADRPTAEEACRALERAAELGDAI
jgi:serine/threonine protein kinase